MGTSATAARADAVARLMLGSRPRAVLAFVTPTLIALACDALLRPRSLLAFEPLQWLNYFGSTLASAGFFGGPIWLAARLIDRGSRARSVAAYAFFGLFVFPLETFSLGGQILSFRVFNPYMARA